jgi:hypothetical protein
MGSSDEFFRFLLTQLAYRSPTIIIFLVGLVLSSVYWSRRPRQSMLVMVASVIGLVTSAGNCMVFSYIVSNRSSMGSRATNLAVLSVVTSIFTAVPYILLLVAALGGRSEQAAFPVQMPPPPPFARRS